MKFHEISLQEISNPDFAPSITAVRHFCLPELSLSAPDVKKASLCFGFNPGTLLFVLSEHGLLEMCHHPVIAATREFTLGKETKNLLLKKKL